MGDPHGRSRWRVLNSVCCVLRSSVLPLTGLTLCAFGFVKEEGDDTSTWPSGVSRKLFDYL